MEIIADACIDVPDGRDLSHEEVFGAAGNRSYAHMALSSVQDQSLPNDPSTKYACTVFSLAHCVNEANAQEAKREWFDAPDELQGAALTPKAISLGLNPEAGWSLQGALKMALSLDYITGYAKASTVSEVRDSVSEGRMVYTGSNRIDWKPMLSGNSTAVRGSGYGHCFCIEGFDDVPGHFICRNSYGPSRFDMGRFYVRFEDFDILFSCYSLTDKKDEARISEAQSKLRRLEAFKLGIWNGTRENDPVTRYEASLMASRAGNVDAEKLWNGERGTDLASRFECRTMVARATGKNYLWELKRPNDNCTRGEMSELCVR